MECARCGADNNMKTQYCRGCGNSFDSRDSFHYTKGHYTDEFLWRNYKIDRTPVRSRDDLPILETPRFEDRIDLTPAKEPLPKYREVKTPSSSSLSKPVFQTIRSSSSSSKGCIWFISIAGILLIIGAVIYGVSVKITTSMSPNQQILYQENGSDNWNGWKGSSEWQIFHGMLVSDGKSSNFVAPTILAPYPISEIADYAVEANIQVANPYSGSFGISVRGNGGTVDNGWQGYWATFNGTDFGELDAIVQSNQTNAYIAKAAFNPGTSWHTYRVEVKGSNIRIFVDNNFIVQVSDSRFPTGSEVGISSFNTQISVNNFKLIAL